MKLITGVRSILFGLIAFLLVACIDSDENNNPPPAGSISSGEITGQILDGTTGQALFDTMVSADGQSTTTATDGSYTLSNVGLGDRVVVTVSTPGFADQSKIVRISSQNPNANLPVGILPVGLEQEFDPDTAQILTVAGSPASVILTATSLVQADGSAPNGNVTINLTVIDPTVDIELMPGDMQTDVGGGTLSPIESFGAIIATFTDSMDNNLNLTQGANATIRIPLADKTGNPPTTIPLYFYNETSGLWVEEGSATLLTDTTGSYYEGAVSHFSAWNADVLYPQIRINGCVEDSSGARVSGVKAVSVGDDYSGTSSAITDVSGNFSVIAKPDSSVLMFGLQAGSKTNTVKLQTTTSDQSMSACLVLSTAGGVGDTAVSIKLSWGESPLDIDAYLVGPDNIRVYFFDQGSLVAFPFSQLDVDDTTSFGPEVITIFNFPVAGTYRYSANNFSETFTPGITGSPARVELNVNGNITLFTPAPGENDNITWDVFEFVVADDGSFNVNPINTWSALSP